MTLVITGAAGRLGRLATAYALERMSANQVILVTRTPASLADSGLEVRYGDFDAPESLQAAFAGADRMLLISTMDVGRRVQQHRAAAQAAVAAGIEHIAYTSGLNSTPENPAFVVEEHAASDVVIQETGVAWTVLANGLYSELRVPFAIDAVRTSKYVHNAGDGVTAYVSREDCAAIAVGVLIGEDHRNRIYDVTGPELHTQAEVAAIIAEIAGRPIEAVEVSDEERKTIFMAAGYSDYDAASATSWGASIRSGALAAVSTAVEDVTGRPPRRLVDVLTEHRAEFAGR